MYDTSVYSFSPKAISQLDVRSPLMTFTQASLLAYLTRYLESFRNLDRMKIIAREIFDEFITPADASNVFPESRKANFRDYIDIEVGAKGLAKILYLIPQAFGTEFKFKEEEYQARLEHRDDYS